MTQALPIQENLFGEEYVTPVMALTWKQPFATLMLHGKIETRTWPTQHRGKVLICAGVKPYTEDQLKLMCDPGHLKRIYKIMADDATIAFTGYAIAVGVLVDCRPMMPKDHYKGFVTFNRRLYAHVYKDVRRINPFKFTGGQKWRNVTDQDILSKVIYT